MVDKVCNVDGAREFGGVEGVGKDLCLELFGKFQEAREEGVRHVEGQDLIQMMEWMRCCCRVGG